MAIDIPHWRDATEHTRETIDTETQDLIEELTVELERSEGMITRLYALRSRAGLVDDSLTEDAHSQSSKHLVQVGPQARG